VDALSFITKALEYFNKNFQGETVRDKIPMIIEPQEKKAQFRVLSDVEYKVMLDLKLHEELAEYSIASEDEQIAELADLVEVVTRY
jgi:predicted house-cleaning noncanonical NTP pyrophosphatase (MazG superfamily)